MYYKLNKKQNRYNYLKFLLLRFVSEQAHPDKSAYRSAPKARPHQPSFAYPVLTPLCVLLVRAEKAQRSYIDYQNICRNHAEYNHIYFLV